MKSHTLCSIFRFILFTATTLTFAPCIHSAQPPVFAYNSFGPGNSYVTYADWGVYGASNPGGFIGHAEQFVPTLSGNLYTVQAAVGQLSGGTGLVNFYVAADNGGTPGATLDSFLNVLAPAPVSGLVTMNSITQPLLQAGTTYWLYVEPAQTTTAVGWYVNDQGYANNYAQEGPPGVWSSAPITFGSNGAFDISVVPVPEPSILGLMILGAGSFSIRRFRRCKNVKQ
jgi:hypothetical protein